MAELFQPDPSRFFPPRPDLLQCSEENHHPNDDDDDDDDEDGGAILFSCTTAVAAAADCGTTTTTTKRRLQFRCRDASIGVLLVHRGDEPAAPPPDDATRAGAVDPFFFDSNYDLYGKTGFQIWPGSRLLTEALLLTTTCLSGSSSSSEQQHPPQQQQHHQHHPLLGALQEQIRTGARVLELGSGVGLVGIALASAGAQSLLTDLPTLVRNAIRPNIERNANNTNANANTHTHTHHTTTALGGGSEEVDGGGAVLTSASSTWMGEAAVPVGRGWAGSAVLDLMKPLADQLDSLTIAPSEIDLVVSSDVLCFRKLLNPALDVMDAIFEASPRVEFLFTHQRRVKSEVFTTLEEVLHAMEQRRGMYSTPECLAWRKVHVGKNDEDGSDEWNDLFLFRTTPKGQ